MKVYIEKNKLQIKRGNSIVNSKSKTYRNPEKQKRKKKAKHSSILSSIIQYRIINWYVRKYSYNHCTLYRMLHNNIVYHNKYYTTSFWCRSSTQMHILWIKLAVIYRVSVVLYILLGR